MKELLVALAAFFGHYRAGDCLQLFEREPWETRTNQVMVIEVGNSHYLTCSVEGYTSTIISHRAFVYDKATCDSEIVRKCSGLIKKRP